MPDLPSLATIAGEIAAALNQQCPVCGAAPGTACLGSSSPTSSWLPPALIYPHTARSLLARAQP
jgi:hypothetical protein